ncbi:unnamed protein product [Thlaspi arvense]|uniref:Uncharacterized protein n=1 Tax=Thlaspi arvense TaxID=13288 RepID=A0AAU9SRN3_THLAR|nr:unnamed protein product [Thlaspi arvense]
MLAYLSFEYWRGSSRTRESGFVKGYVPYGPYYYYMCIYRHRHRVINAYKLINNIVGERPMGSGSKEKGDVETDLIIRFSKRRP